MTTPQASLVLQRVRELVPPDEPDLSDRELLERYTAARARLGADDPRISTLIGIALPIAAYDWEAVRTSSKPKFFIHGERDELCPLKDMREFYARAAEPKELVVIDGADHLFDGKVSEVADAIEDLLGDWSG